MASLDIDFYPKQYEVMETDANEILYGGAAGAGKAGSGDTPVLTTDGWKTLFTVQVGDYVFNEQGEPTRVVAKSDPVYERTFRVWFDKYAYVDVGENHDWKTLTDKERRANHRRTPEFREKRRKKRAEKRAQGIHEKKNKSGRSRPDLAERNALQEYDVLDPEPPRKRTTLEIYETLLTKEGKKNHTVRTTAPLEYEEAILPIDPYMLGVWLGDGSTGSGAFCGFDLEIPEILREKGYTVTETKQPDKNCYVFRVKDLTSELKALGVLGDKHIPEIYKRASVEQRLELIQGIMDTDGYVDDTGCCEISLSHEPLAKDFHQMILSMGIKCNIRQRQAKLYGVRKKDRYRMNFSTDIPLFKLPRHLDRLKTFGESDQAKMLKARYNWYISNVEEIDPVPLYCIQVECDSHMYLIGEHLIPTHNSFLIRYILILHCLVIPSLTCYLFRRKYNDLMQNHLYGDNGFLQILEPFVKAKKCQINLSEKRIDFYHEEGKVSQIFLRHIQHEQDMYNYQGAEIHIAAFDELTHFTEKMYKFVRTRVRLGSVKIDYEKAQQHLPFLKPGKLPFIVSGSNPGGISHNYVKRAFIDSATPGEIWQTPPEEGGMKRVFIPAKLSDNTKLLEEDPHYADRLIGIGGKWALALLDGDWNIAEGGVLSDLWREEIHVIEPFIIPENATILRSLDWGSFHPSAIVYTFMSNGEVLQRRDGTETWFPPGSQIVIHEIYNWNGNENEGNRMSAVEVGKQIAEFEARQPWIDCIRKGPADNQIFQTRGGIHQTMHDLIVTGYNYQMQKLSLELEGFNWTMDEDRLFTRADQSANSRVNGLQIVRAYLKAALEEEDQKGLYFFNTCRHCIRTIPTLPRSESNPEDADTNAEDHLFDIIKYNCLSQKGSFEQLDVLGI